ncbi:TNFAIP3-interacting protein 1 isoform X1 [Mactra antiquata]
MYKTSMICSDINKIDHEVQTSLEYLSDQTRQQFEAELQRLREDKFLLEGKIKGYLTLSDICKEYKEELSTLRQEYNKLQSRINMSSQSYSNESPTPEHDQLTGPGHEKGNRIIQSSPHSTNVNVASSILHDKDTPIKTKELYGSLEHNTANKESYTSMSNSHEFNDKYPMQESLAPDSVTGLGFEKVDKSSDYTGHVKSGGYIQSGDLMKFSIQPPQQQDETANNILLTENKNLKSEIASLKRKLRSMEEQLQNGLNVSSSKDSSTNNDWVHVSKASQHSPVRKVIEPIQQNGTVSEEILILKQNNAQLLEANQRWSSEWNKLQGHYDARISELQTERDQLAKDITDLKISEESRVKDYEKMLLTSKRRANEEESAKEEAFLQLNTANNKLETLQAQLSKAEETVSQLTREKQSIETEINVLRQRPGGMSSGGVPPRVNTDMRSPSELKTENDVLRQQLLVFQEDFDRERSDRAQAQASKDEYKKQNEQLKKRARQVEQKNASLERQVKTLEDTNRRLNEEISSNLQQISSLKVQLQREREKTYTTSQNGWNPPIIQSAGLQQHQEPKQQFMFGQPVITQRPIPYRVPPTYNQARVPQLNNGVVNGYSNENTGTQFQPTNPPENYFRTSQAGKQTEFRAGAWTCGQCTYVNYPGRTVCEMCGYIQNPSTELE